MIWNVSFTAPFSFHYNSSNKYSVSLGTHFQLPVKGAKQLGRSSEILLAGCWGAPRGCRAGLPPRLWGSALEDLCTWAWALGLRAWLCDAEQAHLLSLSSVTRTLGTILAPSGVGKEVCTHYYYDVLKGQHRVLFCCAQNMSQGSHIHALNELSSGSPWGCTHTPGIYFMGPSCPAWIHFWIQAASSLGTTWPDLKSRSEDPRCSEDPSCSENPRCSEVGFGRRSSTTGLAHQIFLKT